MALADFVQSMDLDATTSLFHLAMDSLSPQAADSDSEVRDEATKFLNSLLMGLGSLLVHKKLFTKIIRAAHILAAQELHRKAMQMALGASAHWSPINEIAFGVSSIANEFFSCPKDQDWNKW